MASREYTVDEVVAAIDDWVDSDAGGMSSSEEELLDQQLAWFRRKFEVSFVCISLC